MKKFLAIMLSLVFVVALCGVTACGDPNTPQTTEQTYDITVWVSETADVVELTQQQIDRYNETNEIGVTFNATVEGVSESESATQMITDVESGADLFFFAQDQTMRLMEVGALTKLGTKSTETVKATNDASSILAAQVGDDLYCYPLTSDNGYFMYYNKATMEGVNMDSLEDILAKCVETGTNFSYELEGSGWYNAGFFFATGCTSVWETNNDGEFVSVQDNFNSANGLIALQGMQKVLKSTAYINSSDAANFTAAVPSSVVISGTWASKTVKEALGDNMGVTDLPSFTVDGKSYHIGSFSGNKLLGVKPTVDANKAAALQQLAMFLTSKDCQLERFNAFGWGPSNLEAQANDAVAGDPVLTALAEQNKYAIPQGQIHGKWWDMAKAYAVGTKAAEMGDKVALQAVLDTYQESIDNAFNVKEAWTYIGKIASLNTDWSTDFEMVQDAENANIWRSKDAVVLAEGDEFKVRFNENWDSSFGGDGPGGNYVVATAGTYYIVADVEAKTITLEPAA